LPLLYECGGVILMCASHARNTLLQLARTPIYIHMLNMTETTEFIQI